MSKSVFHSNVLKQQIPLSKNRFDMQDQLVKCITSLTKGQKFLALPCFRESIFLCLNMGPIIQLPCVFDKANFPQRFHLLFF